MFKKINFTYSKKEMSQLTFSSDGEGFSREDLEITSKMSEEYFDTANDPEQFSVCSESKDWMFEHQQYFVVVLWCK